MAREPPARGERSSPVHEIDSGQHGNKGLLTRRTLLKTGSLSVIGALATSMGTVAGDGSFETIRVPAGERHITRISDGQTFENVLFDQTAPGAAATIDATDATGWTIRNVAWKGEFSHPDRAIGVADTGGNTSRIENVYMGDGVDGSIGEQRHPKFGLWVSPAHSGHLEIERMYVEGAHDNAFYASAPGSNANGARGTVTFRSCFAKDNWVSGFRLARGRIENCTAVNTPAGRNGRPLWIWPTDYHDDRVEIVDSNFIAGGYPYAMNFGRRGRQTVVHLEGTHHSGDIERRGNVSIADGGRNGNAPSEAVPSGCPENPEAVFTDRSNSSTKLESIESDDDDPSEYREHTILLRGDHQGEDWIRSEYRIEVDGEIEPSTVDDASIDPDLEFSPGTAVIEHTLANWRDAYAFDGSITALDIDGPARVFLNGQEVDPSDVGSSDSDSRSHLVCRYEDG